MVVWRCSDNMEKIALVTGSSRGIGREIALRLGAIGYHVYIHYFMNEKSALKLAKAFNDNGYKCSLVSCNLGDESELKEIFRQIKENHGYLDLLVNNAATGIHKNILDIRMKDWDWTFNVNAKGAFFCSIYAAELMKNSKQNMKHIINIISSGSNKYLPGYSLIGGSKACIENMTKYFAVELASLNINVNALSSGLVNTDALNSFIDKKFVIDTFVDRCPQKKLIETSEIADAIELLISPKANRICGQTIVIDGGSSIC